MMPRMKETGHPHLSLARPKELITIAIIITIIVSALVASLTVYVLTPPTTITVSGTLKGFPDRPYQPPGGGTYQVNFIADNPRLVYSTHVADNWAYSMSLRNQNVYSIQVFSGGYFAMPPVQAIMFSCGTLSLHESTRFGSSVSFDIEVARCS